MDKYKNKSIQELEKLFINACLNSQKDDYKLVIDLFTNSELKNNINHDLLKEMVKTVGQEKPIKHTGLYLHIRDICNYLEERKIFSKDYFVTLSGIDYLDTMNKTIKYGDLENLHHLLTAPDLNYHSKYVVLNKNVFQNIVNSGHADILDYFLSSAHILKNDIFHIECGDLFGDLCAYGFTGMVDYLMNKAPDEIKPSNRHYPDAFLNASKHGNLDIVKLLMNAESFVSDHYDFGYALTLASEDNNPEVVKYLLTSPKCQPSFDQLNYQRVFHDACHFGNLEFAKYLLSSPELTHHADLNAAIGEYDGYSYNSAITAAIHADNLETIKFLIFDMNVEKPSYLSRFLDEEKNKDIQKMFELREITQQLTQELDTPKIDIQNKKIKL